MRFQPAWDLPWGAMVAALPEGDEVLLDAASQWVADGCGARPAQGDHRLFGYPSEALGGAEAGAEVLWRVALDGAAGFDWGSNAAYVLVRKADLDAGRLER